MQPVRGRPFQRLDGIGGIAADAQSEHEVAGPPVVYELTDENLVIGVIVSEGGHPGDVVDEGNDAEPLTDFVGGSLAEIGREMGSAFMALPPLPKTKIWRSLVESPGKNCDEPRDGVGGNGIERGFLGR